MLPAIINPPVNNSHSKPLNIFLTIKNQVKKLALHRLNTVFVFLSWVGWSLHQKKHGSYMKKTLGPQWFQFQHFLFSTNRQINTYL